MKMSANKVTSCPYCLPAYIMWNFSILLRKRTKAGHAYYLITICGYSKKNFSIEAYD